MTIRIVFFSGTGCTRYVAHTCKKEITARGEEVQLQEIRTNIPDIKDPYDFLIVCFVVHACNAPRPVMDWIDRQEIADNIPAAILSVSGGGEVTPNLASHVSLKKKLIQKKFDVTYEKMITMPSNWIIATKPALARKLIEVLPGKIAYAVEEMLSGTRRNYSPGPGNRFLSLLGRLEKYGAIEIGRRIQVQDTCNGCCLCANRCPVGNIKIVDTKPVFGDSCVLCLNCLYGCPQKALTPRYGKFVVIKQGFNLTTILTDKTYYGDFDLQEETRGFLWLGVRRYLGNDKDMKIPHRRADNMDLNQSG